MTFGSLFAGIGGFDLGLERAGMRCKWQVEIEVLAALVVLVMAGCGQAAPVPSQDTGWAGPDAGGCLEVGLETQGATVPEAAELCCSGAVVIRYEDACTVCPGFCCTPAGGGCVDDRDCCSTKCSGGACVKATAGGTCWDGADCTGGACDTFSCR